MKRPMVRDARQLLPFLLVCLAGGTVTLIQTSWRGGSLPPTGMLLLITGNLFCLWSLWRWQRLLPLLPAPPWRRMIRASQRQQRRATRTVVSAQWQLIGLRLRQAVAPPPARPRPARPPRFKRPRRRLKRRRPLVLRVRLPLPTLDIQFLAPHNAHQAALSEQQQQSGLIELVQQTLAQALSAPPALLAIHDQPR